MKPLIAFGGTVLPTFGIALALAFVAGFFLLWKTARKEGFNEEKIIDMLLLAVFTALVAGRAFYILFNPFVFTGDPGRWFLLIKYPGISFFGSLITGISVLFLAAKAEKLETGKILDLFALPMTFATAIGFVGCFLNGCFLENKLATLPLYLAFLFLFLFTVQYFLWKRVTLTPDIREIIDKPGALAMFYLILISIINVLLEKNTGSRLYLLWLIFLSVSFLVFLISFHKLVRTMVKFPQTVLVQIKQYLEDRRAQTEHRLADLKTEDPFADQSRLTDNAADDTEAHEKAGHERTQALIAQLNTVLIQTRKALTKIKIGKYGTCERCGKMIDTDRLAAIPTATLCLSCEKKKEK